MVEVSNADRVVFPAVGRTKGDVVAYYERVAPRMMPHLIDRPVSIKRFPKGLEAPGFFQKNVPAHYPESIGRFAVPRSREATKAHARKKGKEPSAQAAEDVTNYPLVKEEEHLAYLANQGAIEIHVPTSKITAFDKPDRIVVDLDPPEGQLALVRSAAHLVRDMLGELGLSTVPVATGSKGYHIVAPIEPVLENHALFTTLHKMATLMAHKHPEVMTVAFRVANRGGRVFVDWLRNTPNATVVSPYSLRARPKATVAAPLAWDEIETHAPDAFTIDDAAKLLERPDSLLDAKPGDIVSFATKIDAMFESSGLELETFDRFRS